MTITYTWTVKNLNADQRGYAQTLYLELEGTDGVTTGKAASISVLGGDEYKPMSKWTQEDIDAFAESKRAALEAEVGNHLNYLAENK